MKASLIHECTQRVNIATNSTKFKYLGATIRTVNLEISSSDSRLRMYCSVSTDKYISNWIDDAMFNGFHGVLLEILEDAAAPESVINLVKLHRQNNENKKV